jgi:predicted porin
VAAGGAALALWTAACLYFSLPDRTDIYVEVDHNRLSGAYPLPTFMGTRDTQTGASLGLRHRF